MAERSIQDRMGEALRRYQCGYAMPTWGEMGDDTKTLWSPSARAMLSIMKRCGLKVVVEEGDGKDG